MRRAISAASFFKQEFVSNIPKHIIFVDVLCLIERNYSLLTGQAIYLYDSFIVEQLKIKFPDVTIYVFNLIPDAAIEDFVREKSGLPIFSGKFIADIIEKASLRCRFLDETIYFVTISNDSHTKIPQHYSKAPLVPCTGAYSKVDLEVVLQAIKLMSDEWFILCLDIDDTTIFSRASIVNNKTRLNNHIIKLIEELHGKIKIKEIVFLTSRHSSNPVEDIPALSSEELKQRSCVDVAVVAHHLNQTLQVKEIPHQVSKVFYSNGGFPDADYRKHAVIQRLAAEGKHPILVDNSVDEIEQLNINREALGACQDILPPIRILEHPELDATHFSELKSVFSRPVLTVDDNTDFDSAMALNNEAEFCKSLTALNTMTWTSTLFQELKKTVCAGVVLVDIACFMQFLPDDGDVNLKFIADMQEALEDGLAADVVMAVFTLQERLNDDLQYVHESLCEQKDTPLFNGDSLQAIAKQVTKRYGHLKAKVYFITDSQKTCDDLVSLHFPVSLVNGYMGSYSKQDLEAVMAAENPALAYTLCLDADTVVANTHLSLMQERTVINNDLVGLVSYLCKRLTVVDIIFLTARDSSVTCQKTVTELSEVVLKNFAPLAIESLMHYFNERLKLSCASCLVSTVYYSNDIERSTPRGKYKLIKKLVKAKDNFHPLFIADEWGGRAYDQFHKVSQDCPNLLPPIRMEGYHYATLKPQDLTQVREFFEEGMGPQAEKRSRYVTL